MQLKSRDWGALRHLIKGLKAGVCALRRHEGRLKTPGLMRFKLGIGDLRRFRGAVSLT